MRFERVRTAVRGGKPVRYEQWALFYRRRRRRRALAWALVLMASASAALLVDPRVARLADVGAAADGLSAVVAGARDRAALFYAAAVSPWQATHARETGRTPAPLQTAESAVQEATGGESAVAPATPSSMAAASMQPTVTLLAPEELSDRELQRAREQAQALGRELTAARDEIDGLKGALAAAAQKDDAAPGKSAAATGEVSEDFETLQGADALSAALGPPIKVRTVAIAGGQGVATPPAAGFQASSRADALRPSAEPATVGAIGRPQPNAAARRPAAAAASRPAAPITGAGAQAAQALARAEALIRHGDIQGARLMLERVLDSGSAQVAFALAETYDPRMLAAWGVLGIRADAVKARALYARAEAGGLAHATARAEALR
jgi:hypothetical protein